jgi:hypothetical protein
LFVHLYEKRQALVSRVYLVELHHVHNQTPGFVGDRDDFHLARLNLGQIQYIV